MSPWTSRDPWFLCLHALLCLPLPFVAAAAGKGNILADASCSFGDVFSQCGTIASTSWPISYPHLLTFVLLDQHIPFVFGTSHVAVAGQPQLYFLFGRGLIHMMQRIPSRRIEFELKVGLPATSSCKP